MIRLHHISKSYKTGKLRVPVLEDINLEIDEGEFVAIMGPSGSGKSTLLNVLGLLDKPDSGSYIIDGQHVNTFDEAQLASFRNHGLGFVFQKFHLLPRIPATENVALPLIYGTKPYQLQGAQKALEAVGLGHRSNHRPNELSGGEQQRVAIARALINDPRIIIADEPTGNLDSKSEAEIMSILGSLHAQGKTIIMVTHEPEVAEHASRIIMMRDGKILSDKRKIEKKESHTSCSTHLPSSKSYIQRLVFLTILFKQSFKAVFANKLRSALSVLGILIGVAAVIAMVSIGLGAQEAISERLSSLGSNLLSIRPGSRSVGGVSMGAGSVTRFSIQDAEALAHLPSITYSDPSVSGRVQTAYQNKNWQTQLQGVGVNYASMRSAHPIAGRFFTEEELKTRRKVAVLGQRVVRELFGSQNPIGQGIKINRISFQVIGILPSKGANSFRDRDDEIIIPVTTAMFRVLGKNYVDTIDVEVVSAELIENSIQEVSQVLRQRHRVLPGKTDPFQIRNMSDIQDAISGTTETMSVLLGTIAAISLIVGGIGIMNIMLVSVTERTREIGLRKALGAKGPDILFQFLIESMVLTIIGGILGVTMGVGSALLLSVISGWAIKISIVSITISCVFSLLIGLVFGLWPAYQASKLNPVEALRFE